jgi:hypothetical protein
MHKIMIAAAATFAMMAGSASAAYAESNNLAATEVPATGSGISSGPAMIVSGSEGYPVSAVSALHQSNTAAFDTGSERYQDSAGKASGAGNIGFAQRNGNNAGA